MILVSIGTHTQPMEGLFDVVGRLGNQNQERVVLQGGPTCRPISNVKVVSLLPYSALYALMCEARVVIVHGAPASVAMAHKAGHRPLVVPRSNKEHVDAHQRIWSATLTPKMATVVWHPATLQHLMGETTKANMPEEVFASQAITEGARALQKLLGDLV